MNIVIKYMSVLLAYSIEDLVYRQAYICNVS